MGDKKYKVEYDNSDNGQWFSVENDEDIAVKLEFPWNCRKSFAREQENRAVLIADALNTNVECEKFPSQVLEERNQLVEVLEEILNRSEVMKWHYNDLLRYNKALKSIGK